MKYIVTINNRVYSHTRLKFKRQAGITAQPFEGYFTVAGATLPQKGETILVQKEILGSLITKYKGKVSSVGYLPSKKGSIYILGHDLNRKSSYLPSAALGFSSPTKSSQHFQTQIAPPSDTDLTQGVVDTTDTAPDTVNFGKSITGGDSKLHRNQVLEILQMLSDRDIYISRTGVANFGGGVGVPAAGVDRSSTIKLVDGLNGSLVGDVGYMEDDTRIVKRVIVKGKGAGIKDSYLGIATAGGYVAGNKERQFELPFLESQSTCVTAATGILNELNQTIKYARFQIASEVISVDYDIYDTVKLLAKLPNKNVDENLKIYSIETDVNLENQEPEIITLELANFRRGIWAPLILPSGAADANERNIALSSISTQAQNHVGLSGGSSLIQEEQSTVSAASVTTTESTIHTFIPLIADKIAGINVVMSFRIIPQKLGNADGVLEVRLSDGTSFWPSGGNVLQIAYNPHLDEPGYGSIPIFIPIELSGKTITIKAKVQSGKASVTARLYLASIDEHQH